ncbi:hypothetical protein UPYG_G00070680 [Umbra pygmaea]|uniref:Bucky ball n=1 Tax=Umbra pygmaea TaxID=75934 RepID=A0ABD0XBI9_UMBPY
MRQKMDDRSKNPQSMGNVQQNQRQTQHTKPFFYVQPASQPYYNMYHHHNQWHMSNLYNHYGLPGSGGYPFGRFSPYMSPYPYMQYPGGYVVTHAPHMHPMDYRRMYEPPRFQPPLGHEHMFQHDHVFHHEQQQQHHAEVQRETACSEVQTDPSDSLNKLIECLGKLQTNEIQGSDKELDSGVVSQASGIFCPDDRERKGSKEVVGAPDMHSHSASPGWCKIEGSHVQSSPMATLFSVNDSTAAVYDGESSRSLGDLGHREGWAVDSDHEPPLDSSSVHEEHDENPDLLQHHLDEDESLHRCSSENICLLSAVSRLDDSLIPRPGETDDHVEDGTHTDGTARTQGQGSNLQSLQLLQTPPPLASDSQGLDDVKPVDDMLAVPDEGFDVLSNLDADLSGQISSLPFHEVLTAGTLQTDNPADSAMLSGNIQPSLSSALLASMANSPTRQHYYPYYPLQTAHERLSVLSPSLDELSSRDEMFSTDLDELDLYPRHRVYPGQRFSAAEVQKVCSKSKKLMCACCGSSLLKGAGASSRIKGHHHSPKAYIDDQAVDTDEADEREPHRSARTCEERSHPARVLLKMPSVPRKRQSLPLHSRFPEEHGCRRSQHREAAATREQPVDPELVLVGSEPGHYEDHVMQRETETDAGDQQHRMCKDRQCREGASTTDLCSWETGGAKPRRTPHSLLQERLAVKKVRSNQLVFQDEVNEEEQPRLHRGKGSTKRTETRC